MMRAGVKANKATQEAAQQGTKKADDFVEESGVGWFCELAHAVTTVVNSFPAGTPVLMADGIGKRIEDVDVGDWVLASDPEMGERGARQVTALIQGAGPKELPT